MITFSSQNGHLWHKNALFLPVSAPHFPPSLRTQGKKSQKNGIFGGFRKQESSFLPKTN